MPPDVLIINGHRYVRQDGPSTDILTVAQIHELTGKSVHTINAAMLDGRLPFSVPSGCKRPRRATRADVMAWLQGKDAAGMG